MRTTLILFFLPALTLASGCGPNISETRMAYFPPRSETCNIQVMSMVRPRACKMGGDAISLMASQTSNASITNATGTAYVVLHKREEAAKSPPPAHSSDL